MLSAPYTWAVGEQATAAKFNQHFRDNIQEIWQELAYAEFTGNVALTAGAEVISSGAVTYAGRPVLIEFFAPDWVGINQNNFNDFLELYDDATELGRLCHLHGTFADVNREPIHVARRFTPSSGSHTYKVKASGGVGFTLLAGAGGTDTLLPGFIRVLQKGA